jgi:hypothetical protein
VVNRRILFRCAVVALVLFAQWGIVSIPAIDADTFDESARELQRTRTWRYGYVLPHHGAVLVKARNTTGAPPFVPIEPDDHLSAVMVRELRLGVSKATFELLFYGGLWLLAAAGLPRLIRAIAGRAATRCRWALAVGLAGVLFPTAALAPYLLAGYGEPLFSTWQGPGALSYSGPFPETAALGRCITYRILVEGVLMYPLLFSSWALDYLAAVGERQALWAISAIFYGVTATLVAYIVDTRGRR